MPAQIEQAEQGRCSGLQLLPQLNVEPCQPFVEAVLEIAEGRLCRRMRRIAHDIPALLGVVLDPAAGLERGKLAVHGLSGQMQNIGNTRGGHAGFATLAFVMSIELAFEAALPQNSQNQHLRQIALEGVDQIHQMFGEELNEGVLDRKVGRLDPFLNIRQTLAAAGGGLEIGDGATRLCRHEPVPCAGSENKNHPMREYFTTNECLWVLILSTPLSRLRVGCIPADAPGP